jgi:hypothetical protein
MNKLTALLQSRAAAGARVARIVHSVLFVAAISSVAAVGGVAQGQPHRVFATPEDAVSALLTAVKSGSVDDLRPLFGPEADELIAASDPLTARRNRDVFKIAAAEKWQLVDAADGRKTLVVGHEDWPFPIPLVHDASGWRFDTSAGTEEIVARRIGRNELATLETCRAYVAAQQRYAQDAHDDSPAGAYAMQLRSDPGKQNGLYWPTSKGQKRSPLGEMVAIAANTERAPAVGGQERIPLHGYYFRILTAQGPSAPGGRKSYIVKGSMPLGFALVAWPAQYNVTGVMTFIVNHDGIVYEKDLGPATVDAVRKITAYDPDSSWKPVK